MKSKNKKRILALVLSMVLMLSTGISAMAEGETSEQTGESKTVEQQEAAQESQGDASGAAKTQGEKKQEIEQETETAAQTETTEEITEEPVSEAADLYQDFKDEDGNVVTVIHAYVPEGAFQAKADQISMEAKLLDKESDDYIKSMIQNQLPENSYLGGYVLYEVNFLVDGVITEPAKAITLTIEGSGLRVTDLNRTRAFRYDPADLNVEEDQDELIDMGQKADVLTYLADNGVGEEQISEYEYAELDVQNETANQIGFNTWKSTIYGCYTEAYSAETEFTQEVSGTTVKVTAPEGAFPMAAEEVSFTAAEITEEQEDVISGQLEEKAGELGQEVKDYTAYDLSFTADGEEIQPQVPVTVSFENTGLSAEDINGGQGFWLDEENGTVSDVEGTVENGTASMTLERTGAAGCWTYGDEEVQKEEDSATVDDSQTDAELTEEETSEGTVEEQEQKENETELEEADEQENEEKDDPAEEDEEQKNENNDETDASLEEQGDDDSDDEDVENSTESESEAEGQEKDNKVKEENSLKQETADSEETDETDTSSEFKEKNTLAAAPVAGTESRAVSGYVTDLKSDLVQYSSLKNSIDNADDNIIKIDNWKRSDENKKEYGTVEKLTNSENTHWNWSDVSDISMSLSGDDNVWDGSRKKNHNSNSHLEENQVTAYNETLYDSATWNHYNRWGNVADNDGTSTIHRFQGTFTIPNGEDPNNYDYTIKPVADSNNIFINDDIYVFVYPASMKEKITDQNFMQYLAFWTGTISNSANNDRVNNFHGRTNTKATQNTQDSDTYFGKLTDKWNTPAAEDNAGGIILAAYNSSQDREFIVDVFAEDYNGSGGMYRLEVEKTHTTRVDGQFRKVDKADTNKGVAGAKFELTEKDTQRYYTFTSGEEGIVDLRVVPGTYLMREIEAAPGYKDSDKEWTVVVNNSGNVSIEDEQQQSYKGKQIYYITNESDISGNLQFSKVNTDNEPIQGAEFELYKDDSLIGQGTSGEDGTVSISNIPIGDGYVLKEVSVPSPYVLSKQTWTVNVSADGTTTLVVPEGEDPGKIVNYTEQEEAVKNLEKDKTVTAVPDSDGRTFEIQLSAQTTGETEGEEEKNASVVLVLDASGSMEDEDNNKSLKDIKDAAESFVEELAKTSKGSEVAVIWYQGTEGEDGWLSQDPEKITCSGFKTIETQSDDIVQAINGGKADGGTPMGAALSKANEVLNVRSNENKYVLMFTDGMPGYSGSDECLNCMVANKAYSEATEIKQYAKLYTIGYKLSGEFDWKSGHSGDNTSPNGHEGEKHGTGIFTYYTYNHPTTTEAVDFLRDYIATQGSGDEQYAFTTDDKDGLQKIFKDLAGKVGMPYSIQADSIVDVVDARFKLTAESKEALIRTFGKYINIEENDDGTTTITWSEEAAHIKNESEGGWSAKFQIQAKDNFIGGNMIPTNGAGSGIHIDDDDFVEFPKPTANVKLLNLSLQDKEETVFLGDAITIGDNLYEKILETLTMGDKKTIPNLQIDSLQWQDASDGSNQKTAALDYSYTNTEGQQDVIGTFHFTFEPIVNGNLDSHLADQVGQNVEQYKMTVTYTSKTVGERQEQINSSDSYTDPAGDELTADNRNNPIQVQAEGKYVINVVAGSIQIKKVLDKKGNPAIEGDPIFTFKIEYKSFSETESKVYYRTIRFTGEELEKAAELLDGLPKGVYTVTELATQKYDLKGVSTEGSDAGIAEVTDQGQSVTFTFGADDAENRLTATKGVAAYTNTKTGPSTNTDTDTVVNRFEYNEETNSWEFKQIFIPGEGQKLENKN